MGTPISSVRYGPLEVGPIRSMVWIVGCGPGTAEMMADTGGGSRLAVAGGAPAGTKSQFERGHVESFVWPTE